MHRDEQPTALLVEAQGAEVVIRGDQPHPPTAGSAGGLFDRCQQCRPDTDVFDEAVQGNELALIAVNAMRDQAEPLAGALRNEARQLVGVVFLSARDNARFAPVRSVSARAAHSRSWFVNGRIVIAVMWSTATYPRRSQS